MLPSPRRASASRGAPSRRSQGSAGAGAGDQNRHLAAVRSLTALATALLFRRRETRQTLKWLDARARGEAWAAGWSDAKAVPRAESPEPAPNALWEFFSTHREGPGVWKWQHYFEIYHRHLARFVGRPVNVLEVGVYGGGSLPMWLAYFGEGCHVHGVDLHPGCRVHESDRVTIHVGDQEDRAFWRELKPKLPALDVLIDDGGHRPKQQMATLEEMLPHLQPGGVYLCEDVHRRDNRFAAYASGLVSELNEMKDAPGDVLKSPTSPFQRAVHSIHFYPYVLVIEKHREAPPELVAPCHGTRWEPFRDPRTR